ncbi:alkaline phosphatase family protein [Aeoliella mucimassa]|uniref:Type I phosphodiesterase / nucleotide pyrophosphatase n=1 Tax=Aeoliella mucimassa TaxID=2527972 RepID=A0A518ANW5_9BACT|nr:nucleotide pyrophosphatase/phosphodiesterase family protein [Aeoliella mucimassa]QDU56412.1 Type I phosphodiesterase / nucleotide pyrophosphatase [Aeoliella mucimassa]
MYSDHVVLLSIPGLAPSDVARMPNLKRLVEAGDRAPLVASFPGVTCAVQANMTTGLPPAEHGVVANGFFWRGDSPETAAPAGSEDKQGQVELWTCWNSVIHRPQLWDLLHEHDANLTSAMWFALNNKGCGADYICTFAPIHNPDGSESLWCYTRPEMLYGDLRDAFGHFPLKHFWGPLAGIPSSAWIVSSSIWTAERHQPNFWYIYLPHLDYMTQKCGPQSPEAMAALVELDNELGRLITEFERIHAGKSLLWLVASEYVISPVDHVTYPNRILRELGMLEFQQLEGTEQVDIAASGAFALADHQHSHVFVQDHCKSRIGELVDRFRGEPGIAEVLTHDQLDRYELQHTRSGDLVLVSEPNSWQAYYWWLDDAMAPTYARKMDIHRKPGYDPVELFFDPSTKGIPLNADLVRGSHGAPVRQESQQGVLLSSQRGVFVEQTMADTDVASIVLNQFGAG